MDQLDYPSEQIWSQRREWFESLFDIESKGGAYLTGEHATGLLVDLQSIYCGGAFISCIILACTIIDAHIREAEADKGFDGGMQAAFQFSALTADLDWLRHQRNRLVHFKEAKSHAIAVDMHYVDRSRHEQDARRAIELVANVLLENPFT